MIEFIPGLGERVPLVCGCSRVPTAPNQLQKFLMYNIFLEYSERLLIKKQMYKATTNFSFSGKKPYALLEH